MSVNQIMTKFYTHYIVQANKHDNKNIYKIRVKFYYSLFKKFVFSVAKWL